MKKAFAGTLVAALVAGLMWAALGGAADRARVATISSGGGELGAAARRAVATYTGQFKESGPDTEIVVKARIRNGEVKAVTRMRYKRLPATCPKSKANQISGGWTFAGGVKVNDQRRFRIQGSDNEANPSTLRFSGRFSKNFKRVRGRFATRAYFPKDPDAKPTPLPAETCVAASKRYGASR